MNKMMRFSAATLGFLLVSACSDRPEQAANLPQRKAQSDKASEWLSEPNSARDSAKRYKGQTEGFAAGSDNAPLKQQDQRAYAASQLIARADKFNQAQNYLQLGGKSDDASETKSAGGMAGERGLAEEVLKEAKNKLRVARAPAAIAEQRRALKKEREESGAFFDADELDASGRPSLDSVASLEEKPEEMSKMAFLDPHGYWENTYIPGDPVYRALDQKFQNNELTKFVQPNWQPFDAPKHSALGVYLSTDKTAVNGPTRMLLQVGLKGSSQSSGYRPNMNVGIVVDLRDARDAQTQRKMRAMIQALSQSQELGDAFSLTVIGKPGAVLLRSDAFRLGSVQIALDYLFGNDTPEFIDPQQFDLLTGMQKAYAMTRQKEESNAPLGSSLLLLITAADLQAQSNELRMLAHQQSLAGVSTSVIQLGDIADTFAIDQVVLAGQGNRRFLKNAADAKTIADKELSAISRVVARAVKVNIDLAPGVKLVKVLGADRLDAGRAIQNRQLEQSIDSRIAKDLGIERDREQSDAGIQILIPSFYANDTHVILLDVVADQAGVVADVSVKFKDLVYHDNGSNKAQISLYSYPESPSPLNLNVRKNLLAFQFSEHVKQAAKSLFNGNVHAAIALLSKQQQVLQSAMNINPAWQQDLELQADNALLTRFINHLQSNPSSLELGESMYYAALKKQRSGE